MKIKTYVTCVVRFQQLGTLKLCVVGIMSLDYEIVKQFEFDKFLGFRTQANGTPLLISLYTVHLSVFCRRNTYITAAIRGSQIKFSQFISCCGMNLMPQGTRVLKPRNGTINLFYFSSNLTNYSN